MNTLAYLQLFTEIAERGSLSAVARHKNISTAAVSKKLSVLESHLKTQLFDRNGRTLKLTPLGEAYLQECHTILQQVAHAEQRIAHARSEPMGLLNIVTGRYFAERFILPNLQAFLTHYPQLQIEMHVAEKLPDLKSGQADIAFGMTQQNAPSDLICRQVMTSQYVLSASPLYLKQHGTPKKPEALKTHRYITSSHRRPDNVLTFGTQRITFMNLLRLNDVQSMVSAARHGLGFLSLHRYIVEPYLQSGELVELLPHHHRPMRPIYLFYRKQDYTDPKIRVFIDFFMERMA